MVFPVIWMRYKRGPQHACIPLSDFVASDIARSSPVEKMESD